MKSTLKTILVSILLILTSVDFIYSAGCCKKDGESGGSACCCNSCKKDKNNIGGEKNRP